MIKNVDLYNFIAIFHSNLKLPDLKYTKNTFFETIVKINNKNEYEYFCLRSIYRI